MLPPPPKRESSDYQKEKRETMPYSILVKRGAITKTTQKAKGKNVCGFLKLSVPLQYKTK